MGKVLQQGLRLIAAGALAYACAGKSISSGDTDDDDNDDTSGDDGGSVGGFSYGGSAARGGTGATGGAFGGTSGVPTGGRGGSIQGGRGGTSGIGGTFGGTSGTDFGGFGGDFGGCGGRDTVNIIGSCQETSSCISMTYPDQIRVRRNQIVSSGGDGGQGGESGDSEDAATIRLCNNRGGDGFLSFEYFMPEQGTNFPGITLVGGPGSRVCGGPILGDASFRDFSLPPPGTWTLQCLPVTSTELYPYVTLFTSGVAASHPRVRNLRFVAQCECPRQITRYTDCGDITSPRACL